MVNIKKYRLEDILNLSREEIKEYIISLQQYIHQKLDSGITIDDILDGGVTAAIHDGVPFSKGGESKSVGNAIVNKKIGDKTLFEKKSESKSNQITEAKKNDKVKMLLETFDEADLINVQKDDD